MDPRLLDKDEIELELNIRKIDKTDPEAIDILCDVVEEELAGIRVKPFNVHSSFKTVTGESAEVHWKLASIIVNTGNISELAKCRSRLLHLQGRVLRMQNQCVGSVHVDRLLDEIHERLIKCTDMLNSQLNTDSVEIVRDVLEDNAQQQAQVLLTNLLTQCVTNQKEAASTSASNTSLSSPPDPKSCSELIPSQPEFQKSPHDDQNIAGQVTVQSFPALPSTSSGLGQPPVDISQSNAPVAGSSSASEAPLQPDLIVCLQTLTRLLSRGNFPNQPNSSSVASHAAASIPPSAFALPTQPAHPAQIQRVDRPVVSPVGNPNQGWVMSKWSLRFGGSPKDLPVDEFIFRVETLARLSNLPQSALTIGLHQILTGTAASWFWVYIRNVPDSTWPQTRRAISLAFQSNVSDAAIKRLIMDRLQRPGERFTEFQLAVQELEVRLANRMSEFDLLETLRRNMLPNIQEKLLFVPILTLQDLQYCVHKVEDQAQRQLEVQPLRRLPHLHEISAPPQVANEFGVSSRYSQNFSVPPPPMGVADLRSTRLFNQVPIPDHVRSQADYFSEIGAIVDRNEYTRCWNCDELGHTFMDCSAQRIIFCYGCGEKNYVRPQCPKCSLRNFQGNGQGSIRPTANLPEPGRRMTPRYEIHRRPQ